MTDVSPIDVRDLKSVRQAAEASSPDVVLGDDWVSPQAAGENENHYV